MRVIPILYKSSTYRRYRVCSTAGSVRLATLHCTNNFVHKYTGKALVKSEKRGMHKPQNLLS